jgi:hypothetical protein
MEEPQDYARPFMLIGAGMGAFAIGIVQDPREL